MTQFIAEVGSNHNGSLARALELVDTAAAIGCTGVKFQYISARALYVPGFWSKFDDRRALDPAWLPTLQGRAHANGLRFGCSVFAVEDVPVVAEYADYLKVASYSLLYGPLLDAVRLTTKPVVLGTGMATLDQIGRAVQWVAGNGFGNEEITLLHCVSGYPTPVVECNLNAMDTLRYYYGTNVGWSDHSGSMAVLLRAVLRHQASMVEAHMDLDGDGWEFGAHCWLSGELHDVIAMTRDGEPADGTGEKLPQPCELAELAWRADPRDGLRPLVAAR